VTTAAIINIKAQCKNCGKKIGFKKYIFSSNLCDECKKKIEFNKRVEALFEAHTVYAAEDMLNPKRYKSIKNPLFTCSTDMGSVNDNDNTRYALFEGPHYFCLTKDQIISSIIKHRLNLNNVVVELKNILNSKLEEARIAAEMSKINDRKNRLKIREEAEKRIFGQNTHKKRITLSDKDKNMIYEKYNNECAICGSKEGLHIHHKDHNPENNTINNLIVLCGVCHKKIHMKVR
jgi:hypothetical protein